MQPLTCSDPVCELFLNTIIPVLGNLVAIMTVLAPIPAVLRMRKNNNIGDINPIPMSFIYLNSQVCMWYGMLIRDVYVVAPNLLGTMLGAWFVRSAYGLASSRQRKFMDLITSLGPLAVYAIATLAFLYLPFDQGRLALGSLSILYLCLFYTSPLSDLWQVLKTRNASLFDVPIAVTCFLNGVLWTTYGLTLADPFIYGPNVLGTVFAAIQLACRLVFPSTKLTQASYCLDPIVPERRKSCIVLTPPALESVVIASRIATLTKDDQYIRCKSSVFY